MLKYLFVGAVLMTLCAPVSAAESDIASTIISMERTALESGTANSFLAISAPDVIYQDPSMDKPIEGLEALTAFYAKFPADTDPTPGEMSNPHVQVMGDVAVLSFHYVSHKGGKRQTFWNCTEVYRKTDAGWRIVNTHWSLPTPPKE